MNDPVLGVLSPADYLSGHDTGYRRGYREAGRARRRDLFVAFAIGIACGIGLLTVLMEVVR